MENHKIMKCVRHNVWETNSSSSHSISICSGMPLNQSISPDKNGTITLEGGEFGWGPEKYTDALTKANYCAVDNLNNPPRLEMLKEVIKKHTGAKTVVINVGKLVENSYIDHQSCGTSIEAFESEKTLRDFLFLRSSVLYIDHDNH